MKVTLNILTENVPGTRETHFGYLFVADAGGAMIGDIPDAMAAAEIAAGRMSPLDAAVPPPDEPSAPVKTETEIQDLEALPVEALPDFAVMTKAQIVSYAKFQRDLDLDPNLKKEDMVRELESLLRS